MEFSRYQRFVVFVLAFLQFTVILDFMILAPLGAVLLKELGIGTVEFGLVVSAYAFSAGASGLMTAGFADKFDRKKLLLFFYSGFVLGTVLCGVAPNYHFLLAARIVTGIFGGVIGSISMAIIADLFAVQQRGRVMGIVQTSFAASQVLGLPFGLFLANHLGWRAPFLMIAGIAAVVGLILALKLAPIDAHLKVQSEHGALRHMLATLGNRTYMKGFAAMMLLSTGGFMLMPFGSAFTVNNLGVALEDLPLIYMITGAFTIVAGPLIGRLSDRTGKYPMFVAASIVMMALVVAYTHLGKTPLWAVILVNVVIFSTITARMITSQALMSSVPEMKDRGAFMSINNSIAQISGAFAAALAGAIVAQRADGHIDHYPTLGYVVTCAMLVSIVLMYGIHKLVTEKPAATDVAPG